MESVVPGSVSLPQGCPICARPSPVFHRGKDGQTEIDGGRLQISRRRGRHRPALDAMRQLTRIRSDHRRVPNRAAIDRK